MNFRTGMMGAGAALAVALAAQSAQAQTCPTGDQGGGGPTQVEVGQEGDQCQPLGVSVPFSLNVDNANGVAYTATGELAGGEDYLQPGDVIEVELDYEEVLAELKSHEHKAVAMAGALGLLSAENVAKTDIERVNDTKVSTSNKLNDAEFAEVANYIHSSLQQGQARGRSDPAPDPFVRRIEAFGQAFGRAMDSIGRNIRVNVTAVNRQRDARNVVRNEQTFQIQVNPSNPPSNGSGN